MKKSKKLQKAPACFFLDWLPQISLQFVWMPMQF